MTLGSLDAVRDWSFAGDVMRGAWLMLQQEQPEDYVLASGVGRTVAQLAETAFACVGLEAERYMRVDPKLVRAPERTPSVGDPSKAREQLGWEPELSFEQLVQRMVEADLRELQAVAGRAGPRRTGLADSRMMTTVGIIGLGYVGLPLAVAFAEEGCEVVAVDVDPRKVDATAAGGRVLYRGHSLRARCRRCSGA